MHFTDLQIKTFHKVMYAAGFVFVWILIERFFGKSWGPALTTANIFNLLMFVLPYLFIDLLFWWSVGEVTGERRAAYLAFSVNLLSFIFLITMAFSSYKLSRNTNFIIGMLTSMTSYGLFGWLRFKNKKALWLLIAVIAYAGVTNLTQYKSVFSAVGGLIGGGFLEDLFLLSIRISETSSKSIYILEMVYQALQLPLQFLLFFFVYDKINENKMDWKLTTTVIPNRLTATSYSMIYHTLRFMLFALLFGGLAHLSSVAELSNIRMAWMLLSFALGVYVLASFFRNFVTGYLANRGKKPSWQYLIMNIPILHIFAWIHTLLIPLPKEKEEDVTLDEDTKALHRVENVQKNFGYSDHNQIVKVVLVLFMIISLISRMSKAGMTFDNMGGNILILLVYSVVSIVLALWYMNDHRAMPILLMVEISLILIIAFLMPDFFQVPIFVGGLINLVVYFSLFHVDKMTFTTLGKLTEEKEIGDNHL